MAETGALNTANRTVSVTREHGEIRGMRGKPGLVLLAVALGVMMVALDGTIIAVANPAIQSHLHASLADIHSVFASGMSAGFVVGSIVAVAGAAVGLLARGSAPAGGHGHAGI